MLLGSRSSEVVSCLLIQYYYFVPQLLLNMPKLATFCATALSLAALVAGANEYSTDQLQNGKIPYHETMP